MSSSNGHDGVGGGDDDSQSSYSASLGSSSGFEIASNSNRSNTNSNSNSNTNSGSNSDEDVSQGELIDGLVFPSSLPEGVLDSSFASLSGRSMASSNRSMSSSRDDVQQGREKRSSTFVKRTRDLKYMKNKRQPTWSGLAKGALAQAVLDAGEGDGDPKYKELLENLANDDDNDRDDDDDTEDDQQLDIDPEDPEGTLTEDDGQESSISAESQSRAADATEPSYGSYGIKNEESTHEQGLSGGNETGREANDAKKNEMSNFDEIAKKLETIESNLEAVEDSTTSIFETDEKHTAQTEAKAEVAEEEGNSIQKLTLKQRMEMYLSVQRGADDKAKEKKTTSDTGTEMLTIAQRMEMYLAAHLAEDDEEETSRKDGDLDISTIPLVERLGNYLEAGWSSCSSLQYEPETAIRTKKGVDLKTHRRVLGGAATKIQKLVRRYLHLKRKREKEAAVNVVNWLKQYKNLHKTDSYNIEDFDGNDVGGMVEALEAVIENFNEDSEAASNNEEDRTEGSDMDGARLGTPNEIATRKIPEENDTLEDSAALIDEYCAVAPLDTLQSKELSEQTRARLVTKRKLQHGAVTKIQALIRGYKVRAVDHERIEIAVQWLKAYKMIAREDPDIDLGMKMEDFETFTSMPTTAAKVVLKSVQEKLDAAAIKIQAITRGYNCRQFDYISHARARALIATRLKNNQVVCIDGYLYGEPDKKNLDKAWAFLEESNTWTKGLKQDSSINVMAQIDGSTEVKQEQLKEFMKNVSSCYVSDLVDTWEWLASKELEGMSPSYNSLPMPSILSGGDKTISQPQQDELSRLRELVKTNRASISLQVGQRTDTTSDIDVSQSVQLWNWLASHGMNMNVFRDNDLAKIDGENRVEKEGIADDPRLDSPTKPTMKSMVTFWDFSMQYATGSPFAGDGSKSEVPSSPTQSSDEIVDVVESSESTGVGTTSPAFDDGGEREDVKSHDSAILTDVSQQKPNMDKFFGTLAWLRSQGLNFTAVGTGERLTTDDSSASGNFSGVLSMDDSGKTSGEAFPSQDCVKKGKVNDDEDERLQMGDANTSSLRDAGIYDVEGDDAIAAKSSIKKSRKRRSQTTTNSSSGEVKAEMADTNDSDSSSYSSHARKSNTLKTKGKHGLRSGKSTSDDTSDASDEGSKRDSSSSSSDSDDEIDDRSDATGTSKKLRKKASPAMQWLLQKGIKAKATEVERPTTDHSTNKGQKETNPPRKKYTFAPFVPSKDMVMAMAQRKLDETRRKAAAAKQPQRIMSGRDLEAKFESKYVKQRPGKKPSTWQPSKRPSKEDMESALHFLQQKQAASNQEKKPVEEDSVDQKPYKQTKEVDLAPQVPHPLSKEHEKEEPSSMDKDYVDALRWLSGQSLEYTRNAPYFEKIDSMLPHKASETREQRAKALVKALKWVKKQGPKASLGKGSSHSQRSKEKSNEASHSTRAPPRVKDKPKNEPPENEDFTNCYAWLSNKEDGYDIKDAAYFKKLDSMLPKKPGQSDKDRARDMVKALKWVKKASVKKKAALATGTTSPSKLSIKPTAIVPASVSGDAEAVWWGKEKQKGTRQEGSSVSNFNSSDDDPDVKNDNAEKVLKKQSSRSRSKSPGTKAGSKALGTKARSKSPGTKRAKKSMKPQEEPDGSTSGPHGDKPKPEGLTKQKSKSKSGKKTKGSRSDREPVDLSMSSILDDEKEVSATIPESSQRSITKRMKQKSSKGDMDTRTELSPSPMKGYDETLSKEESEMKDAKKKRKTKSMPVGSKGVIEDVDGDSKSLKKSKTKKKSKSMERKPLSSSADEEQAKKKKEETGEVEALKKTKQKQKERAPESPKPTGDADVDNMQLFLHAKESGGIMPDMPDAAAFKRLDNMMPTKPGQSLEDRAKDMKRMLVWLRKKGKAI